MEYFHTMVRVSNIEQSLVFYGLLGLEEVRRTDNEEGRFTLVFLAATGDRAKQRDKQEALQEMPLLELTYNWDAETYGAGRNFGHLAYWVSDIYAACKKLKQAGVVINRPPRDGRMAFVRSPDGISIELLQRGEPLPAEEPWLSMGNTGSW